jgi:Host cell surface-exposed lipoprotein
MANVKRDFWRAIRAQTPSTRWTRSTSTGTSRRPRPAASFLEASSFSRSGLIEQLEFEGFTHAQAVFGVQKAY